MPKYRAAVLIAVCILGTPGLASFGTTQSKGREFKFSSERSPYPFAGATRVVLEGFDPEGKEAKTAMLQLDKNAVAYSAFGEPMLTAVFYKPFPVTLSPLSIADPSGQNRRVFAIELPKEIGADLGKKSMRLVTLSGKKSEPVGVRLLLVNPDNKVTQVLELRAVTN